MADTSPNPLISLHHLHHLLLLFVIISQLAAATNAGSPVSTTDPPPAASVSATTACNSALYRGYCRGVVQTDNSTTANVYEYGIFSVKRSISQASRFLKLVNKYLSNGSSRKLTSSAVRALQDCQALAELNLELLIDSLQMVHRVNRTLSSSQGDDIQTMLSAIVTNQQTCLDGLQSTDSAWSVRGGLVAPLSDDSKLYSVALALVTKGWVPKNKKKPFKFGRRHSAFKGGRIPLKMLEATRQIFETASRQRLASDAEQEVAVRQVVVVSQDGTGNFTAIGEAVEAAPNKTEASDGYFLIYIKAGVYDEYVSIDKKKTYIMMIGDGINQTIITGNRSVAGGWTTYRSATLAVVGAGFVAVNITVRNTAGPENHQAVALRSGADLSAFYSCSFEGYQDTLYVHSMRQFYGDCDIYGTVDFIFGNAAVVFQDCNMYPRLPMENQFNAITAQGRTDPNQNTGISIHNCTIRAAPDLASAAAAANSSSSSKTKTYLGRPWKGYSRTVYMQTSMDSLIEPAGWQKWDGDFALNTLYYGEYANTGPGSDTSNRVNWTGYHIMNAIDASNFTASTFLLADDWLPQTGVTYFSGLL